MCRSPIWYVPVANKQDEIFHIPQFVRFCEQRMQWDPKITTPPGLYLVTLGLRVLLYPIGFLKCAHTHWIRCTNVLALCLVPWLCSRLRQRLGRYRESLSPWICATLPPLWFFGFLYYTDVLSVAAVLTGMLAVESRRYGMASLVGWCSLWFRQNNIVWVLFMMGVAMLQELQRLSHTPVQQTPPLIALAQQTSAWMKLIRTGAPFLPVLASFATYVWWNDGSIVLGDKSHHQIALHVPQLGYFFAFALAFGWPVIMSSLRGPWRAGHLVQGAALTLLGMLSVHYCTMEHPFLLADNRHYTFYVWRRVVKAHEVMPYVLVLVYVVSAMLWVRTLARSRSTLWIMGWLVATGLTVVPSSLIEPRYFLVSYLLLRLYVPDPSPAWEGVELTCHMGINVATILLFVRCPFRWPQENGWQRFMW